MSQDQFNFLSKKFYNNEEHYTFCNNNNDILNELNSLKSNNTKCPIQCSISNVKCNKKIKEYNELIKKNIKDIKNNYYDYEINYIDFNIKNTSISKYKDYKKSIHFNNFNKKYNNDIYQNENNYTNMNNIQELITNNDEYLLSLDEDKIKTLQYYTYRGDIFLNCYINNDDNCFNVEENIIHRVDDNNHMFYSEELEDYLFKVQMLKIFKDNKNIIQKIEDKQLNNYDISEEQYILIFNQYIKDINDIFRDAPKTDKEIYLYRGVSHNYIIKNIRNGIKKYQYDNYRNNNFLSSSLFVDKAYNYTHKKNKIIYRFTIKPGVPLIFLEGISLAKGDMEVLIPNNTILKINDVIDKYLYDSYNTFTKDIICPREYSDINIVDVINIEIMSYNYHYH
jgi:hypothetical protein